MSMPPSGSTPCAPLHSRRAAWVPMKRPPATGVRSSRFETAPRPLRGKRARHWPFITSIVFAICLRRRRSPSTVGTMDRSPMSAYGTGSPGLRGKFRLVVFNPRVSGSFEQYAHDVRVALRFLSTNVNAAHSDPGNEPKPPLRMDEGKEERNQTRPQRRLPVASGHGHESAKHLRRWILGKEEIAKLRRVEADDEATERRVALTLASRVSLEPSHRQIAGGEALCHGPSGFKSRLERDRDTGGEDRIEKGSGIACQQPPIAGVAA